MTSEWFIWYGMHMGLSYDEANDMPLSRLLDLISIQQIKEEGYKYRRPMNNDEELAALLAIN